MRVVYKPIKIESGSPVVFLPIEAEKKLGVREGERVLIRNKNLSARMPVNYVEKLLKRGELSLSQSAADFFKPKPGELFFVKQTSVPESSELILKKLDGKKLSKKEIYKIIEEITDNSLTEAEVAYFISAVYMHGMSFDEVANLTRAMADVGEKIQWKDKVVCDKHSIGGVAGNRTTPIVVSICAAAGLKIPKTSSRAITSAAGTADVVETIANVSLSVEQMKRVVEKTNACLAWGGSLSLSPADDKIIKIERLLNLDPEPQLLASILSKKLAAGSNHVVIDIPYGRGAKVSFHEAKELKKKFEKLCKMLKIKVRVVLTNGSAPIGNGVGPMLEMRDVMKVLRREQPPKDLEEKAVMLAGELLELAGKAKKGQGKKLAHDILNSKKALQKFEEIVAEQGKQKRRYILGRFKHVVRAKSPGRVAHIDNKAINHLARVLGSPFDKGAGVCLHKKVNSKVKKRDAIITLYSNSHVRLAQALELVKNKKAGIEIR
ncbi:AMP phosphorylase [Candidatus Pacearchaeota archaeon]|nr:MAG: AMP phosphorylase [Candidatus Pacearchaeota archaeon]